MPWHSRSTQPSTHGSCHLRSRPGHFVHLVPSLKGRKVLCLCPLCTSPQDTSYTSLSITALCGCTTASLLKSPQLRLVSSAWRVSTLWPISSHSTLQVKILSPTRLCQQYLLISSLSLASPCPSLSLFPSTTLGLPRWRCG